MCVIFMYKFFKSELLNSTWQSFLSLGSHAVLWISVDKKELFTFSLDIGLRSATLQYKIKSLKKYRVRVLSPTQLCP